MSRALIVTALAWVSPIAVALAQSSTAPAQTVWSGFDFSFSKANSFDPPQPEDQDRITDNIWLTRDVTGGIFNIRQEEFYGLDSPADTEWATDLNNPSETIAATNWAVLTFDPWIDAYGGQGGMTLPARLTSRNAVVHLITDGIYLDLRFTSWTSSAGGGGFSYDRAEAPTSLSTTGDYNGNGVVDAADYVVWRKTLDQSAVPAGSGADGDMSGTIDSGDYTYWSQRFGNIVVAGGNAGGTAAVPEPAAAVLLVAGLFSAGWAIRKRP